MLELIMSPGFIRMAILALIVLVIAKALVSVGQKILSIVVAAILTIYIFVNYIWPFILKVPL